MLIEFYSGKSYKVERWSGKKKEKRKRREREEKGSCPWKHFPFDLWLLLVLSSRFLHSNFVFSSWKSSSIFCNFYLSSYATKIERYLPSSHPLSLSTSLSLSASLSLSISLPIPNLSLCFTNQWSKHDIAALDEFCFLTSNTQTYLQGLKRAKVHELWVDE